MATSWVNNSNLGKWQLLGWATAIWVNGSYLEEWLLIWVNGSYLGE
jgi:hypothetical protein